MLVDGFLALRRAGVLKRHVSRRTAGSVLVHAGFFLGNRAFYDELKAMPPDALAEIVMTAISFTNTLGGDRAAKIAQRRDARFVNTALVVTLLGAASADQLDDGRVVSGIGGQGDFVSHGARAARRALDHRGARGAQRAGRQGDIECRLAARQRVSIPRQLRDVFVTEYGIADVRGRSDREVAEAMLAIADSRFQAELQRGGDGGRQAAARSSGCPPPPQTTRLSGSLRRCRPGARAKGCCRMFPLGTEMTDTEQALIRRSASCAVQARLDLARLLWRGAGSSRLTPDEEAALVRLALRNPAESRSRRWPRWSAVRCGNDRPQSRLP